MDWANENYDQTKKDGGWGDWRFDHARAYILAHKFTEDDKYIERGVAELRCLLNTLSFERGINNSLDVLTPGIWAGRTLPDAYFGFLNHKAMTPQEHTLIVEGYTRLADALFCDGTIMKLNHVQNMFTTAAFGLFKASVIFPEFRNSSRWREQSLQWIKEIADNHILDDGAWEEVSQNYSYVVFVDFSKFIQLCRVNKIKIEPLIEQKYMLFAEFLNKVALPNGVLAIFGHSLEANHINFVRRFFELAYPEKCSDDRFKLHTKSTHFPDARMVIMRSGDGDEQRFMTFDYGPEWSHTDNDCLGISLFAYKEYLIPNIGDMGVELPRLASRLLVNGVGLGEGRAGEVSLENDIDYASASKQLYAREPAPARGYAKDFTYSILRDRKTGKIRRDDLRMASKDTFGLHTRELIFIKPYYWILVDWLTDKNAHVEQFIRLNPEHSAKIKDNTMIAKGKTANLMITHIDGPNPQIAFKNITATSEEAKVKRANDPFAVSFGYKYKGVEAASNTFVSTLLICPFPKEWTPEIQKDESDKQRTSSIRKIIIKSGEFKDDVTLRYAKGKTSVTFKREKI